MNLQECLKEVNLFDKLNMDLLNVSRLDIFEDNLLGSMVSMYPFVSDSYVFFSKTLREFKNIDNYFRNDDILSAGIKKGFTSNFSMLLNDSYDAKHNNMVLLAERMLNNGGSFKNGSNEIIDIFLKKLNNGGLNRSEIINFNNVCGVSFFYCKADRKEHSKKAYQEVIRDFNLDIRAYQSCMDKGFFN